MAKTTCSVSRAEFRDKAKALKVEVNGVPMMAEVKEFSTGSFGWYLSGKTAIEIDGKTVSVQVGANLTVIGSKELPKE